MRAACKGSAGARKGKEVGATLGQMLLPGLGSTGHGLGVSGVLGGCLGLLEEVAYPTWAAGASVEGKLELSMKGVWGGDSFGGT